MKGYRNGKEYTYSAEEEAARHAEEQTAERDILLRKINKAIDKLAEEKIINLIPDYQPDDLPIVYQCKLAAMSKASFTKVKAIDTSRIKIKSDLLSMDKTQLEKFDYINNPRWP